MQLLTSTRSLDGKDSTKNKKSSAACGGLIVLYNAVKGSMAKQHCRNSHATVGNDRVEYTLPWTVTGDGRKMRTKAVTCHNLAGTKIHQLRNLLHQFLKLETVAAHARVLMNL